MRSKKALMGYAAILIVLFHFYIPFSTALLEQFLYRAAFIGVDIFFFVSACSLGRQKQIAYGAFIKNRLVSTYVPFISFALIAAIYKGWHVSKFFAVICGLQLLQKGGGAFLWFIPGMMLIYLCVPGWLKVKRRWGLPSLIVMLVCWLALVLILQYLCRYTTLMILLNRLPVFLIGFYVEELCCLVRRKQVGEGTIFDGVSGWISLCVIVAVFCIGAWLTWKYGFRIRIQKPIADGYYIVAIPWILSIIGMFEWAYARLHWRLVPLEWLGRITLELYGLQMIFGFDLENMLMKKTHQGFVAFTGMAVVLVAAAWLYHVIYARIRAMITRKRSE